MKTLSSSLHGGVFHFRLGIPSQLYKVTQLSSLQMPTPQKETTLLRRLLAIVQLYKQKQSTGILLKCVFPSNQSVIFSCTISTLKQPTKCECLVKRKQSFVHSKPVIPIVSHCIVSFIYFGGTYPHTGKIHLENG